VRWSWLVLESKNFFRVQVTKSAKRQRLDSSLRQQKQKRGGKERGKDRKNSYIDSGAEDRRETILPPTKRKGLGVFRRKTSARKDETKKDRGGGKGKEDNLIITLRILLTR